MTDKSEDPNTIKLTPAERAALKELLADRLWWDEAKKRFKTWGALVGGIGALLAFLAMWWPWITSMAQAILKDVPR